MFSITGLSSLMSLLRTVSNYKSHNWRWPCFRYTLKYKNTFFNVLNSECVFSTTALLVYAVGWCCSSAQLLRRRGSARLHAQRLVQPHDVRRRRVRTAVVLRPAQRRPATSALPRRDAVSDRGAAQRQRVVRWRRQRQDARLLRRRRRVASTIRIPVELRLRQHRATGENQCAHTGVATVTRYTQNPDCCNLIGDENFHLLRCYAREIL